jgi:dipeptidyl-peptidase 4
MKSINYLMLCLFSLLLLNSGIKAQYNQRSDGQPRVTGWADDNHYLLQSMDENNNKVIQKVNIKTGKSENVPDTKTNRELLNEGLPAGYTLKWTDVISPDGKSAIISKDNNLYYFQLGNTDLIKLTDDETEEMNPAFSPDGKKIAYTRNRDLYIYDLINKKEVRLTFDATDKIYNGWSSWVYMEEILGRASRYAAFWWSPDGNKLAYLRTDDSEVPLFTLNRLDQEDGIHGKLEVTPYPKPGDPNPRVKMGIADIASTKTTWVKTDESVDQYIAWPFWTPDSKKIAIQVLNRDQNDMQFILADPNTGDYMQIYRESRKAWVDFFEDIYVMENGSGFILRSYRNDWHNLYYHAWDGKLIAQLTNFDWKVSGIDRVDEEAGVVYFSGTGPESTDKHSFRVGINGKNLVQVTNGNGSHNVLISPKGSYFIDTWNSISSAGAIELINKNGKQIREIHKFEQEPFECNEALTQRVGKNTNL